MFELERRRYEEISPEASWFINRGKEAVCYLRGFRFGWVCGFASAFLVMGTINLLRRD
jgi:hypothetical protein